MVLKNSKGTKVAEFEFDDVCLSNFKTKCLAYTVEDATGEKPKTITTVIRISALDGYSITLEKGKVITLTGSEHEILAQLKEIGIGFDKDGFIPEVAVKKLAEADSDTPDFINIVVVINEGVEVEIKFDRTTELPKVADVIAKLEDKDEFIAAVANLNGGAKFTGLAVKADGKALKETVRFAEDRKVYCLFSAAKPVNNNPTVQVPPTLENTEVVPTGTAYVNGDVWYNYANGRFTVAHVKIGTKATEGLYYRLKATGAAGN